MGENLECHVRDCAPWRAKLSPYRKTRALVSQSGREEMPEEMRAQMHRFLLDRLGAPRPA